VFICPSSQGERAYQGVDINGSGGTAGYSNWPTNPFSTNLSYSYTCPFPTTTARQAGFKLNFTLSSDFAVAADMNPGTASNGTNIDQVETQADLSRAAIVTANSNNHAGDGQNVLYADGHVDWAATPYAGSPRPFANTPRDNIYTGLNAAPTTAIGTHTGKNKVPPFDQYDSVMLPTDDTGG